MKLFLFTLFLLSSFFTHADDKYRLEMTSSNYSQSSWGAIRYIPETGQSWFLKGDSLIEIMEKSIPPRGEYQVKMVETKKGWAAARINKETGEIWRMKGQIWQPLSE